jgi:hypothetical protein
VTRPVLGTYCDSCGMRVYQVQNALGFRFYVTSSVDRDGRRQRGGLRWCRGGAT